MNKTREQVFAELTKPFEKDVAGKTVPDIYWRVSQSYKDEKSPTGMTALMVAYIDARHVYNRLNEVCGANWAKNTQSADKEATCVISIKFDNEWVDRDGMAGETHIEPVKGKESKSVVRAGAAWGIGTYLYDIPMVQLPCKAEAVNNNKATAIPYTKHGKQRLFGKDAISNYINVAFSVPLMKLAELASIVTDEDKKHVGEQLKQVWNYYADGAIPKTGTKTDKSKGV
jgi:hypothetical protein